MIRSSFINLHGFFVIAFRCEEDSLINVLSTGGKNKMIKKILLSVAAGVFLTAVFSVTPVAEAACQGFCADRHLEGGCVSDYAGCTIHYDSNDNPIDAECFYVGTCVLD
jgi:hypothetical protein